MLKMYHKNLYSGNTTDYWEDSWDEIEFEDALKLCAADPIRLLFEKYTNENSLILEGGCGKGHWVAYFAERNFKIIGLDFAQRTLAELNNNREGLSLCGGNVNALPFADNTFDIYYSGGVVEHFEDGCEKSLSEAHRVLKNDGTLLISVPYFSPLRRFLKPFRNSEWRKVSAARVDEQKFSADLTYFQYAYKIPEFEKLLAENKLKIVETQGYSVIFGLYDIKFLNNRANQKIAEKSRLQNTTNENNSAAQTTPTALSSPASVLKSLVLGEDESTPINRAATKFMRWSCANMMMYVCKKA